jgi:hypothetical protein
MGDWGDVSLDDAFPGNPYSPPTCVKIIYSAAQSQSMGFSGIYWQYPDSNWGDQPGRDLSGYTRLTFWARGELGGEQSLFKAGGLKGESLPEHSTGVVTLSKEWQQYTIDLEGADLSNVVGGFCWTTTKDQNPTGCTIYLDEILYE